MPGPGIEKTASLRFGVMCSGPAFQRWQADALNQLAARGHQLVLLIVNPEKAPELSRLKKFLNRRWSVFLFTFLENRFFKPDARKISDMERELAGVGVIRCRVDKKGYSEYFSENDIKAIGEFRLDFILRFGFNIIRGDILTAARYGVWSFHHDDELCYRGGPAGFWEIFNGDPVSGAVMQRLTHKLDGGIILKKGYLKTMNHSYRGNLEQLLSVTSSWPALVADTIASQPAAGYTVSDTAAPVYKLPGNLVMARFLLKLLLNRIRFYKTDLFCAEDWNIAVIGRPIQKVAMEAGNLKEADISWLPAHPRNIYLADPSGFLENGKLHILAEEYNYAAQKACVSEIRLPARAGALHPVRVIDSDRHLSYPYVIEHGGEVYCLPESYQSGSITLYRRDPSTGKFAAVKTLVENAKAVDPTLFFYNGYWWLFYTTRQYSNSHLFISYATELEGEYKPHGSNPVKIDVRSARPAGTPFIHNDILFRPAQDCSVTYGGRVVINRVTKLTVRDFAEEVSSTVEPLPGTAYGKGLHTLSGVGDVTLVDGKRYVFNLRFFMNQLKQKLAKTDRGNV